MPIPRAMAMRVVRCLDEGSGIGKVCADGLATAAGPPKEYASAPLDGGGVRGA
jgi:hypothetical protein